MEKDNLMIIVIALVAIVGIVALVLSVGGHSSGASFSSVGNGENIAGDAKACPYTCTFGVQCFGGSTMQYYKVCGTTYPGDWGYTYCGNRDPVGMTVDC